MEIMKKIVYSILLFGWLFCANSCCNFGYDYDNLFPEEYAKILSVKNSETVMQTMSSLDESSVCDMIILKGGARPSEVSDATIVTWSDEELNKYSIYNGKDCKIIPSDTYSLSTSSIHFAPGERAQHVLINFKPVMLAKEMIENPEITYLLPLKVISEDSVMENKKEVIIQIDMNIPTVSLSDISSKIIRIENKEQKIDLQANLTMFNHNLDAFTCPLVYAGDEYVVKYNESMGTNRYMSLPEISYGLNDISLDPGVGSAFTSIVIHKDMLEENKFYVLPIKVGEPSNDKVISDNNIYYIPIFNPSHVYEAKDCDRKNWEILYCNSDDATGMDARAIFDDNLETFWHSAWQGVFCYDYDDCYDYDNTMKRPYKVCLGKRNLPITIVLDMKESVWIHSLGLVQRSGASNRYIKGVEFYVSDDETFIFNALNEGGNLDDYSDVALNKWEKIYSDNSIPQEGGVIWRQIADDDLGKGIKGHLLKIKFTSTYHNSQDVMSMAELYIKKVYKVDGEQID